MTMNASRSKGSRPKKLKRLPPEVWTNVFEFAAFVPGLMDVDVADPFDVPHSNTPTEPFDPEESSESTATLCSLVRVCRKWYAIAMPVLYRCFCFYDDDTLARKHYTVLSAARKAQRPRVGPGNAASGATSGTS
ncbi:hypothetical protein EVG20_g2048 [Dentipellis fragilis]|uniref:F-box domain-containing protein n=1 Tax=Dentipellis fragilis TaxID=205917 RepID=A0A4Y9ZAX7_9AGAM|nr:hypothetical protein EVG20_g2048 [Dentipellis fragilis]